MHPHKPTRMREQSALGHIGLVCPVRSVYGLVMPTKKQVLSRLSKIASEGESAAAKFAAAFAKDPGHALEWSIATFDAVAKGKAAERAIAALTDPESKATIESLLAWSTERVIQQSESPSRSTSPTANLWAQCSAAGWARVAEILRKGY